jgi:hypothetical protein
MATIQEAIRGAESGAGERRAEGGTTRGFRTGLSDGEMIARGEARLFWQRPSLPKPAAPRERDNEPRH